MEEMKNYQGVEETNKSIVQAFLRMFLGLLVTGITACITYGLGIYDDTIPAIAYLIICSSIEIILVLILVYLFKELSPTTVTILFYLYAFINGISMGIIFYAYEIETIGLAFITTSLLFGALAVYGYTNTKDITKPRTIILMALIVGSIMSILYLGLLNDITIIMLNLIVLTYFCFLTIHDINRLKNMKDFVECEPEKIYIYCAMELYLDFINMFLKILKLVKRFKGVLGFYKLKKD